MHANGTRWGSVASRAGDLIVLACAAGAAEVTIRFFLARETVPTTQLVLAMLADAALLGSLSLGVGALAFALFAAAGRVAPARRSSLATHAPGVTTAAAVAVMLWATDAFGLAGGSVAASSAAASAALLFAGNLARRTPSPRRPICSPRAKLLFAVAWGFCVLSTLGVARATYGEMTSWAFHRNDRMARAGSPNVVLIVLDTLRADRVGVYGGGKLTPNLDRLAESSLTYTQAISTAPWTLPTHASLFTGLYPDEHGVNWGHYKLSDEPPTLAELYDRQGYDTFALSNNFLLDADNGFDRGFGSFLELHKDSKTSVWRFALTCGALHWIGGQFDLGRFAGLDAGSARTNFLLDMQFRQSAADHRPFFTFVNYFEVHDPYLPPMPYLKRWLTPEQQQRAARLHQKQSDLCKEACGLSDTLSDDNVELLSALYDAEVAYQDAMVGDLVDKMRARGLLENTWLIVTSDHGELFGEGGQVFHTAGANWNLLHVPLFVRPPGGVRSQRIDQLVQPVDIFARLVDVAGAHRPAADRALALPLSENAEPAREACIAETHGASIPALYFSQAADLQHDLSNWLTWITSVYADGYLLELHNEVPAALYDVRADPRAEKNVLEEHGDVARSLMEKLRRHRGRQASGENS